VIQPTPQTLATLVGPVLDRMAATHTFRNFPCDYLAVDIETTGVEKGLDLIVQIGHCAVVNGVPVDRSGTLLDWTAVPSVDQRWLADRLALVKKRVEFDRQGQPTGKHYHVTYDRLRAEGADPIAVLRAYRDWFAKIRADGLFLVSHNGNQFDAPFLSGAFSVFLGEDHPVLDGEMFDTGMVEKALRGNLGLWAEDTPKSFFDRVGRQPLKGVRWALDAFAIPQHGLHVKHALDMSLAHTADYDAYLCHLLFQHYLDESGRRLPVPAAGGAAV
jgi:DNA polymerase III epsilon subunit-like protein